MKLIKLRIFNGHFQYEGTKKRTVCRMVRVTKKWKPIFSSGSMRYYNQPLTPQSMERYPERFIYSLALTFRVDGAL